MRIKSASPLLLPVVLLLCCIPARAAAASDDTVLDAQALSQLEQRAQQANPRDQCFLYVQLVHALTETAGRQLLAGEVDQAYATLKKVNQYAALIHTDIADNSKRVKNAEELMHHTTYRLNEYLHQASFEDRETLQATLKQLNQVHDELLAEVFKH